MNPFLTMIGYVFLVIAACALAAAAGLAVWGAVALVAGLLGHPIGGSLDRHTPSHTRPPMPLALRTAVLDRDGWECVYCGSRDNLQIDHIIPVSRGGATVLENLEVLCQPCNEKKGAR